MASLLQVGTSRTHNDRIRLTLQLDDGRIYQYTANEKALRHKTPAQVTGFIDAWAAANDVDLPPYTVHQNADGSWALAVGGIPLPWPEEEPAH